MPEGFVHDSWLRAAVIRMMDGFPVTQVFWSDDQRNLTDKHKWIHPLNKPNSYGDRDNDYSDNLEITRVAIGNLLLVSYYLSLVNLPA